MPGFTKAPLGLAFVLGLMSLLGCSSGEAPRGNISGKVIHKGQPVTAGDVVFQGDSGPPYKATIDPQGNYQATGLPLGTYKVAVETSAYKRLTPPPKGMNVKALSPVYVAIPGKYEKVETSKLSTEVKLADTKWDILCD